jgi:hypothetical protein
MPQQRSGGHIRRRKKKNSNSFHSKSGGVASWKYSASGLVGVNGVYANGGACVSTKANNYLPKVP